jgi:aminoglycoside phosphotransferase (APT) family kinase protein
MVESELLPSAGALEEVRRLAGPSAAIQSVVRLAGGQHADTWRVDARNPELTVVVRQFPAGDRAGAHEQRVLRTLDGLEGLAPVLLGADLDGRWSGYPTTLVSWLDGQADITPTDPESWAIQLGHALAVVHAMSGYRLAGLPSVFDRRGGSRDVLDGPLETGIRSRWTQITDSPMVLTHSDYWSGNVVWREATLTGVVDWSGGSVGPRGYDIGWCRLDLVLLLGERTADIFLAAYEGATGGTIDDIALWDGWAVARSHRIVETWTPNYAPLGRADLNDTELRRRHSQWTARLLERLQAADASGDRQS